VIPTLRLRGINRALDSTLVMGVVNASPESFSDAGRFSSLQAQIDLAASLIESGADIIDVGGQSAITNQPELEAGLERERVLPIVEWLAENHPDVLISVDTYKPEVVAAVLAAGADIINDVSGLKYPELASMCAEHGAALVIMHTAAPPKVRLQRHDLYDDITSEVCDFLVERMEIAVAAGLSRDSVILDPGPDFTKTPRQTVDLLRNIDVFRELDRPLLLALSRKDFLGAITGRTPKSRDAATAAALAFFASAPGNIVRVHDVKAAVDVIATVETMIGKRDIAVDYVLPDSLRYEPRSE
jgi:dihydropteroate synthase